MKQSRTALGIILVASLLGGCATKYQDMGFTGGVAAQPITGDTYRIVARGNGFTDSTSVQDFVLLKAAKTAVSAGQIDFILQGVQDASKQEVYQSPGFSNTNVIGNTAFTTYTPGTTSVSVKPGQNVIVRVFTPNKNGAAATWSFRSPRDYYQRRPAGAASHLKDSRFTFANKRAARTCRRPVHIENGGARG